MKPYPESNDSGMLLVGNAVGCNEQGIISWYSVI